MDDVLGHLAFLAAGTGPWSGATVQARRPTPTLSALSPSWSPKP